MLNGRTPSKRCGSDANADAVFMSVFFLRGLRGIEGEQVARLALERTADRLERGKADRLGLAGLEDRQVGERDVDALGQFRQRHAARVQQFVEVDDDCHGYTVPSRSARMRVPSSNTRASTNSSSTVSHGASEKPMCMCSGCA